MPKMITRIRGIDDNSSLSIGGHTISDHLKILRANGGPASRVGNIIIALRVAIKNRAIRAYRNHTIERRKRR